MEDFKKSKAQNDIIEGINSFNKGRFDLAILHFKWALEIHEQLQLKENIFQDNMYIGLSYYWSNNIKLASDYLENSFRNNKYSIDSIDSSNAMGTLSLIEADQQLTK
jgi:hypothetical protein